MNRNVKEQAEQGRKIIGETNADLWEGEVRQLFDIYADPNTSSLDGFYDAITAAFEFGAAVGYRAAKRAKK